MRARPIRRKITSITITPREEDPSSNNNNRRIRNNRPVAITIYGECPIASSLP